MSAPAASLTSEQVLAWRMGPQLIDPIGSLGILETVRATCGVQAQVASWAELAVALRRGSPRPGEVTQALPSIDDAARVVIPAYLSAYGPATMKVFDAWLTRGATRAPELRRWFELLGDRLSTVEVDGERCLALTEDLGHRGRVAGVWALQDDVLAVTRFEENEPIPLDRLDAEAQRVGAALGRELRISLAAAGA